jgi:2-keto-3-deoxy-L-fuconate dehydrogenase
MCAANIGSSCSRKRLQLTELTNKKALVTGAAGGIGKAIVAALKSAGASVALADRNKSTLSADACFPGDLLDAVYADTLPKNVSETLGGLDIVINNAGVITRGDVTETSDADWALSVGVNVEAPFRICRAAIPIMAARGGGVIVNIASCWGGKAPGPKHALYCMTKAAIASLTQCMGMDHAHQGIRINAVCPNEVNTPMLRSGFEKRGFDPDRAVHDLGKTVPLGRIAEPEDIADVVVFLASDSSRYMTGALVEVNGGKPVS